jgi:hypothetical protein
MITDGDRELASNFVLALSDLDDIDVVTDAIATMRERMQMPDYVTIKLYADTRKAIRLIAAETGEQMVQVMDRLCREEMQKLGMSVAANVAATMQTDDTPQSNAVLPP